MKVPRFSEGDDPAAIVSFEMEQMILPRISGIHVPAFVAAGDFPSLYDLLHEHGREPWYGSETIGASAANSEIAELLDYPEGGPLVSLVRLTRDFERRPIEYSTYVVRADRYAYEINLVRQQR